MKYLNDEEVKLLNEMKDRCLNGGQYKDENAKNKFNMLCHLEDFAVQYYNLQEVIKEARETIKTKLQKSFAYDYGLSGVDATGKDRLFTETVIELQLIDEILSKGENK